MHKWYNNTTSGQRTLILAVATVILILSVICAVILEKGFFIYIGCFVWGICGYFELCRLLSILFLKIKKLFSKKHNDDIIVEEKEDVEIQVDIANDMVVHDEKESINYTTKKSTCVIHNKASVTLENIDGAINNAKDKGVRIFKDKLVKAKEKANDMLNKDKRE